MKTLFKLLLALLLGAAAIGAYLAWRGGYCKDWMSKGGWSEWTCDDEDSAEA